MNETIISVDINTLLKFLKKNEKSLTANNSFNFEVFYNKLFKEKVHNMLLSYLYNETLVIFTSNSLHNNIMLLQDVKFRDKHIVNRIYQIIKYLKSKKYNVNIKIRIRLLKDDDQQYFFEHFLNLSELFIERISSSTEINAFDNLVKTSKKINIKKIMHDSKDSEEKLLEVLFDYSLGHYELNQTKTLSTKFIPITDDEHVALKCKICSNTLEIQNGNKKNIIHKESKYLYKVFCNHSNSSTEVVKINIERYKDTILKDIQLDQYIDFVIYNYHLLPHEK